MMYAEWLHILRAFSVAEIERYIEARPPPPELLEPWQRKMNQADLLKAFDSALRKFTAPIALAS